MANLAVPMRLVIDGRYLSDPPSGIGSYVRALVARLPLLAPDIPFRLWVGSGGARVDTRGLDLHRVSARANSLMTMLGPWALDRLRAGDLFHAPSNVLGFGLPCPAIVTVHDVMWLERPDDCQPVRCLRPISRAYFGIGIRRALRKARRILTVSHASARAIERTEPSVAGKVVVTHNACESHFRPPDDVQLARAKAARILGFNDDYLLIVGQNQRTKGHDVALRAFASARFDPLKLVLVQRLAPGRGLVELIDALGLADRVRIVASLEQDEFLTVMQGARALLQPSYAEGFGLPALEAAACGCPVVASDIPSLREVLDDAALFPRTGDVADWASAMAGIVTNPELDTALRGKGTERAKCFSWDRTARATLHAYREVFAETGALRQP